MYSKNDILKPLGITVFLQKRTFEKMPVFYDFGPQKLNLKPLFYGKL